jgi:3-isopropylmalate/(R)-2-methylmalate dehydratase small subunit
MVLYGTIRIIGDDISTAQIIAPEYRDDPATLAAHCLVAVNAGLAAQVVEGDVLMAGQGFGAGDDPESAVLALQALGFAAIIVDSAAPSFVEAAHAYGLPVLIAPHAVGALQAGSVARIDLLRGTITDRSSGIIYQVAPSPPAVVAAAQRAQLLFRMRRMVEEEGFDG